jgi:hypothetical protein
MQRGVAGVVGLVVALLAAAGAQAAVSGATQRNHAQASGDARRQLAAFSAPAGAKQVSQDSSAHRNLSPCPPLCNGGEAVIDDSRFWRVPGDPQSVAAWEMAHAPAGARVRSSGPEPGYQGNYQLWFSFGGDPGHVVGRTIIVEVAPAKGGGSAMRADSETKWIVTRPRWDRIPKSVRVVTVTFKLEGHPSRPVTFTGLQALRRIKRSIDHAQVRQPGPFPSCPFQISKSFSLSFRARRGGPVLARANPYFTCPSDMSLSVRGRHGPLFISPTKLLNVLVGMGAASECSRSDLALETSGVHRSGSEQYGALELVDQGPSACEIQPGSKVTLLGSGHRPLAIPVSHRRVGESWFVAPHVPLGIHVTWARACRHNQVAAVQLRVAGEPPLSARIQNSRDFAPCQAKVELFLGLV